jgi:cysteinyl-tRNA synthetase
MMHLYDTAKQEVVPFSPGPTVLMYTCGITPYDATHLGHAFTFISYDILIRRLTDLGHQVKCVRNVTDVDDPLFAKARELGVHYLDLAAGEEARFTADMNALGALPMYSTPRASSAISDIRGFIGMVIDKGFAYQSGGSVYFDVTKSPTFGEISHYSSEKMIELARERGGNVEDPHKRHPLDFVLWKSAKSSEPADVKWASNFGEGRPGWHIECSAMACQMLGNSFDIHGGGADLQFPHHENEIAQSEGATGQQFAQFWMHNGFINVDNEKMSKSLGNFFTIREVLKAFDAETVRFFLVRSHYRTPLNYSDVHLNDARGGLKRLYTALQAVPPTDIQIDWSNSFAARFKAAMDEDFGTPEAVAILFDLAGEVNRSQSKEQSGLLKSLGAILGVLQADPTTHLQAGAGLDEAAIQAHIQARADAKAAKNFAEADRIRKLLLEQGVVLKDSALGTTWEALQ